MIKNSSIINRETIANNLVSWFSDKDWLYLYTTLLILNSFSCHIYFFKLTGFNYTHFCNCERTYIIYLNIKRS